MGSKIEQIRPAQLATPATPVTTATPAQKPKPKNIYIDQKGRLRATFDLNRSILSLLIISTLIQTVCSMWTQANSSLLNGCRLCQCNMGEGNINEPQRKAIKNIYLFAQINSWGSTIFLIILIAIISLLGDISNGLINTLIVLFFILSFIMCISEAVIAGFLYKNILDDIVFNTQAFSFRKYEKYLIGFRVSITLLAIPYVVWKSRQKAEAGTN